MHLHIIGICGTFMGGLAQIAQSLGHRVTGCDSHVYPPMSSQLEAAGIGLIEGFEEDQFAIRPDLWVVGNVARRGLPIVEKILNSSAPMVSGPQWMHTHLLRDRRVIAVAGTHGKTTTSSLVAWLLESAGVHPGFLIGGVPEDFGQSARAGEAGNWFVIEADEYDTAFFDKRSKFLHYPAEIAVINNLEFDHADIFPNVESIETQFHHWIRCLPTKATVVANGESESIQKVLDRGLWSQLEWFNRAGGWQAGASKSFDGREVFDLIHDGEALGSVRSPLWGAHNRANAVAAIVAARAAAVDVQASLAALSTFQGVKRRMQKRGEAGGISVYDDFAHHPTAIETTLAGLRDQVGRDTRILAVLEPRSNTMKMGVMRARLADSLREADRVFGFDGGLGWDLAEALGPIQDRSWVFDELSAMVDAIVKEARAGDAILVMSNGGFGGIHEKLLDSLGKRSAG